jgi:hypothetical protein
LKHITKNKGLNFNWKQQFDEKKEVYKLTIVNKIIDTQAARILVEKYFKIWEQWA